jgi:hypothetical protein
MTSTMMVAHTGAETPTEWVATAWASKVSSHSLRSAQVGVAQAEKVITLSSGQASLHLRTAPV